MNRIIISAIIASLGCFTALRATVPQVHLLTADGKFHTFEGNVTATHSAGSVNIKSFDSDHSEQISNISELIMQQVGVPHLIIKTPGNPDLYQIEEKETYLDATIRLEGNGYVDDLGECAVSIKGRGNTTWQFPKRPMRLKFAKKTSLAGMKKAKSYVLLANYVDPTQMRNALAMWLAREMGIPYANHMTPVNVTFNGHSLGAFNLTEKIGINSGSVDIDESKGILLELSNEYDEPYKFRSSIYQLPVMVKDPDFDEMAEDPSWGTPAGKLAQWQDNFNQAELLATQGRSFEAFDLNSCVDYILLSNIVLNSEIGYPKSVYMYKEAIGNECKWQLGPVWDYDVTFNIASSGDTHSTPRPYTEGLWINPLFDDFVNAPGFMDRYNERLQWFVEDVYPRWMEYFDEYASLIHPSALANGTVWPDRHNLGWCVVMPSSNHSAEVADLRLWIENRVKWLQERAASGKL